MRWDKANSDKAVRKCRVTFQEWNITVLTLLYGFSQVITVWLGKWFWNWFISCVTVHALLKCFSIISPFQPIMSLNNLYLLCMYNSFESSERLRIFLPLCIYLLLVSRLISKWNRNAFYVSINTLGLVPEKGADISFM